MSKKVKVNSFHNLTRCVHRTSRDKDKIGFQKMKMKLQIAAGVLIFVLFELSLVQFSTCSPVPDISERQKSVYHNIAEKKEKCPQGLHKCTCVERNNRGRKLDITCNGVDTHELKHDTDILKQGGDHTIQYFKIRNCEVPRLPDHIFMGMKIQHLYIHNCEMLSLDTASISSQGTTLSHLVLSKNKLKDVPTRALRMLKNLDHLNLNDNQITSLHDNAFEGLSKVTRLSLYDNKIHHIAPQAFSGLTKDLIRLNLGRNQIYKEGIPYRAFQKLSNLQILEMSDNQIRDIKPEGFKGLENLDQLVLNYNNLSRLDANWFKGLDNLHDLKLCNNKIASIDDDAFDGLEETLESLELTENKLTTFPSHALRPIHKLVTLHIDHNEIRHISENAFQGFGEKIKYLWMQENLIDDIPPPAFQDLHSLEWVKLYNNQLKTLHYELMEPVLDSLMHIDIHSNPLVCDCELRWYKQWIEDEWNPVEEQWLKETSCKSPRDGKRHNIEEVDLKDMFCDSSVKDKAGRDGGGAASIFRTIDWLLLALFGVLIQVGIPSFIKA